MQADRRDARGAVQSSYLQSNSEVQKYGHLLGRKICSDQPPTRRPCQDPVCLCKCAMQGNPRRVAVSLCCRSPCALLSFSGPKRSTVDKPGLPRPIDQSVPALHVQAGTLDTRTTLGHGNSKPSLKRRLAPRDAPWSSGSLSCYPSCKHLSLSGAWQSLYP